MKLLATASYYCTTLDQQLIVYTMWQSMTKERRHCLPVASPVFVAFTVVQEPSVLPTSPESYGQLGSVRLVHFSTDLARNCNRDLRNTFPAKMFFQKGFIFAKMRFS